MLLATRKSGFYFTVQLSLVQFLDRLGRRGDWRDDSAEILFQSFLQEAVVSSSVMGRDVHSLMIIINNIHQAHFDVGTSSQSCTN